MSYLGLYRDPVVAEVTRRCDWRIADIVGGERPTTLYLVVPPSDINRTKPLIRLILNQIGRRLTEELHAKAGRRRLLLMLDEFPALGRLDFFESALAFMAGYGIKSFLIAQSLNQIEKAYGPNNSILDNCHVRVSFAKRLDQIDRKIARIERDLGISVETLATFIRFWLTTTPPLPEPAAKAARSQAGARYDGFVAALGRRLHEGPKLRQEIPEDIAESGQGG